MITVHIESGICGFNSVLRAHRIERKSVGIAIKSDCGQVAAFGDLLQKLNVDDVIRTPLNKNGVYEKAGKCNLHASCPVPCGVIKAAEVELGLALMKDVRIIFQNDNQVADDAT